MKTIKDEDLEKLQEELNANEELRKRMVFRDNAAKVARQTAQDANKRYSPLPALVGGNCLLFLFLTGVLGIAVVAAALFEYDFKPFSTALGYSLVLSVFFGAWFYYNKSKDEP